MMIFFSSSKNKRKVFFEFFFLINSSSNLLKSAQISAKALFSQKETGKKTRALERQQLIKIHLCKSLCDPLFNFFILIFRE